MAGLFKKIASAFVQMDASAPDPAPAGDVDADALIAELEGSVAADGGAPPPLPPPSLPADTLAVLEMTPDEIYAANGLADGPSSSPRVAKMLAGLAAFPPAQQLAMLRALDAADDTWSEDEVLADARTRQGALRQHLQDIERARAERLQSLEQKTRETQETRQATLAEIDAQIAELTKLRDQAVSESASALADLERQKQDVELAADKSRKAINEFVGHLGTLVSFFTSGGPPPRAS
jgi:hypothetical protein